MSRKTKYALTEIIETCDAMLAKGIRQTERAVRAANWSSSSSSGSVNEYS